MADRPLVADRPTSTYTHPTERCPSTSALHPVACAIGCADASIPVRQGSTNGSEGEALAMARPIRNPSGPSRVPAVDMTRSRSTTLATPVDLRPARQTSDAELRAIVDPAYRTALRRLPADRQVYRGIQF